MEKENVFFNYIIPSKELSYADQRKNKKILKKEFNRPNELIIFDQQDSITHAIQASITPEVFVYNSTGGLLYSGAVDDKYSSIGNYKQYTQNFYLINAITAFVPPELAPPWSTKNLIGDALVAILIQLPAVC
jgi:hypothetical protein